MKSVTVLIGSGSIGVAIARRVSAGKHVLLADLKKENADAAAAVLSDAGFEVSTATVDVSSCEAVKGLAEKAASLGEVTGVIHAAGVSSSQASPKAILSVDHGPEGAFITGSDFLMDGGVTSSYFFGGLAP